MLCKAVMYSGTLLCCNSAYYNPEALGAAKPGYDHAMLGPSSLQLPITRPSPAWIVSTIPAAALSNVFVYVYVCTACQYCQLFMLHLTALSSILVYEQCTVMKE